MNKEERPRRSQSLKSEGKKEYSNIIFLRKEESHYFYISLAKSILYKGNFDEVELHAVGESCIFKAFQAIEVLTRVGYAIISRIKTKCIQERYTNDKISKIFVILKKTPEFNKLYEEFAEIKRVKREAY